MAAQSGAGNFMRLPFPRESAVGNSRRYRTARAGEPDTLPDTRYLRHAGFGPDPADPDSSAVSRHRNPIEGRHRQPAHRTYRGLLSHGRPLCLGDRSLMQRAFIYTKGQMREVLDGRLRTSDPETIVPLDEVLKLD